MNPKHKKYKLTIAALIALLFLLFISASIPLKYYPTENLTPIKLYGKTVFISDIHLPENSGKINFEYADNLVIIGDVFHYPGVFESFANGTKEELQGEISRGEYIKTKKGFCKIFEYFNNTPEKVYYLSSHPPHDPTYLENFSFDCVKTKVYGVGQFALFETGNFKIIAHHGHYIANGAVDGAASLIGRAFNNPLPLEKKWRENHNIKKDYWLITGHSHIPAIDYENKVANTGGWNDHLFLKAEKAYIAAEENTITLHYVADYGESADF